MLLPSALPGGPRPRLQRMVAYAGQRHLTELEPSSPQSPLTPQGIDGTCDALQAMLGTRSQPLGSLATGKASSPRSLHTSGYLHTNARIVKRPPPAARPRNWRKRGLEDDLGEGEGSISNMAQDGYGLVSNTMPAGEARASTPKRMRRYPPSVPFGLEHQDFLDLDEGLDDDMVEEAASRLQDVTDIPVDEGYGSMELPPGALSDALLRIKNEQSQQRYQNPFDLATRLGIPTQSSQDGDAMSVSTPGSGAELPQALSRGLSPRTRSSSHLSPLAIPDISLSDREGSISSHTARSPYPFHMDTTSSAAEADEPALPILPQCTVQESNLQGKLSSRPTISRLPSLAHSDPILPTPNTPTHPSSFSPDASPIHANPAASPSARTTIYSWTTDDDRALVGLVVEKLRLKKRDWDACARALGADGYGASLGRRWRELVGDGCVGLKFKFGGAVIARNGRRGEAAYGGNNLDADQDEDDDELREGRRGDDPELLGKRIVTGRRAQRSDVRDVRWS